MSMSEGNKLLQELHQRLTGHWYGIGKYKGVKIDVEEVKDYINKIKKEYDEKLQEKDNEV